MAESDGEFIVDDLSSDDLADHQVGRNALDDDDDDGPASDFPQASFSATRSARAARKKKRKGRKGEQAAWEQVKRSWDTLGDGEDGDFTGLEFLEAEKRRRLLRDTTPLQRGIIRHLVLVIDMSFAMASKDYLPSYYRVALSAGVDFVREYFEQNPISQLSIVGMKDGVAVRISEMGGNPAEHIEALRKLVDAEPQGNPSLQNALEMCRGSLFHAPTHGTREVLIIFGALLSSDPGDIHDTITSLIADRIRVSIVGLAAAVAICTEICAKTNPGDEAAYKVPLHDVDFHAKLLEYTTPPVTRSAEATAASLLMMGFPSRSLEEAGVSLCACHGKPVREGYLCTRCSARVCRLPTECPICSLTLILSTHLARSYHHLFPLRNWVEVPWAEAVRSKACFACLSPFPDASLSASHHKAKKDRSGSGTAVTGITGRGETAKESKGVSESGRYGCEVCGNHFCIDCDVYAHEVIHNCPGCQGDTRVLAAAVAAEAAETNGHGPVTNGDAMVLD